MILSSGDIANSMTVADGGSASVYSGGTANYTTVNSWGSMSVFSGGTANNTTINSGYMSINSGGTANNTTVNSGGWMMINRGGKATNIVADSGAGLAITIAPDTYIQGTSVGSAFEIKGHINGYKVDDRRKIFVESGGVASNTWIQQGGWMEVNRGGEANHTTVNSDNSSGGGMYINNGGMANHTTVSSGGYMRLLGKHGGKLNILSGATVHVSSETIIDFTVAGQTPGDMALITNWNLISGAPVYTMTINVNQAAGNYPWE